jgi:16S rRNA (cytosine967-C5)-methyltransferase
MVRPGGRLVYATCSLLTAENDAIIEAFLASHPEFTLTPAATVLARHGIVLEGDYLRLLPHQHNTDGFFAAVLDKKA